MTTTSTQDTHPYGGYGISGYRSAGGEETERFEAFVTLHGQRVLHVSNDGCGGCCTYQPASRGAAPATYRGALRDFEDYATHWSRDSEFAGTEDADRLVYRLAEVHWLNRRRGAVFLIDDESYFETGQAHGLRATSHDEAIEYLRRVYPGRNARIWDRTVSEFVPVD